MAWGWLHGAGVLVGLVLRSAALLWPAGRGIGGKAEGGFVDCTRLCEEAATGGVRIWGRQMNGTS